jgi:DNA-binding MarR family transcriptional regulator
MTAPRPSAVAEEPGERTPFQSAGREALEALLRTADEARHHLSRRLECEGMTLQQHSVLRILREAGPEGLPTLDIAQRMIERQPGVTRLVDRLVRKGLVERRRGAEDRRQVVCALTPAGRAVLARLDPVVDEADDVLGNGLAADDLRTLLDLLDRIRSALADNG